MRSKSAASPRESIDADRWLRLKVILAEALEQNSTAARTALLESRCAGDTTLLAEAESLIREAEALLKEPTDHLEDCAEHATVTLWSEEPDRKGWRIGAYVVERELGRGGMGSVYLAERADGQFEKQVAIKVLKRGTDTDEVLRRFAAERHILARLDHPNIAHLLDAGTTDVGLPYFVMEYVAGEPVTRFVVEQKLSIAERLEIFLKICAAVELAHHSHVIHRDLKPGNILVNADGEPKLLDFGIAKLLTPGEDLELTGVTEQRLTPICASPEQADGRPVTEASDVYALGALLYEILSGQKPHKFPTKHPSREEIALVLREHDPVRPSTSVSDPETARLLRGDLDAIVLFAMRKEPEARYATVKDFAADIRRHLAHQPVLARRRTASYRMKCLVARHRHTLRWAAALLVIAGMLTAFWMRSQRNPATSSSAIAETSAPSNQKSIAVLPFESFGDNDPSTYFAEGVQDNILNDLGKVGDLKVISRSGIAAYRGKPRDIKEIGRILGVANVLEGSVQKSGDRVRINAQLIDTQTDTQIWAEHYDRKLEDIFTLQSELAQTIVTQLKATLSSREKAAIWKRPTQDMEAYDLYLRARAGLYRAGPFDPKKSWGEAVNLLNAAIARDANFALAYCLLNEAYLYIYRFGNDHSPSDLAAARTAAEKALQLEPELEEARLAMARYYYHGLSDYRRTLEQLSMVPSSGAHEVEFYSLAGLAERRMGHWAESVRDSQKACELDPRNPHAAGDLMQTFTGLRRFADSDRVASAALQQVPPEETSRLWLLKEESAFGAGNLEACHAALAAMPAKEGAEYQFATLWLAFVERDFAKAKTLVASAENDTTASAWFWLTAGSIAQTEGDPVATRHAFERARDVIQNSLQKRPNDPELLGDLGVAEAGLGNKDEALHNAQRAVELLPVNADALTGPMCLMRLAQVYAQNGDSEAAFKLLASLVKLPFGTNYGDLKFNPTWDDLRSDPRFEQILTESKEPASI